MNNLHSRVMISRKLRNARYANGFTLIELLIGILIISILVAIVVPVYLGNRRKADRVVAEANLRIGGSTLMSVWGQIADKGFEDGIDAFRDWYPPDELKGGAGPDSGGYIPVDARYMSYFEMKMTWADLSVAGISGPIAAADLDGLIVDAGSYGFRIEGVWKSGRQVLGGEEIARDWSVLPGKVGVLEDDYYWDEGWHENTDNRFITLITLERSGVAHFLTFQLGTVVDYGSFNWDDGVGNPGDSWRDDEPPVDEPPEPEPPDVGPPGDEPPDVGPPGDEPPDVGPPGDEPPADEPPGDEPPGAQEPVVLEFLNITPETLNLRSNGVFSVFLRVPGYRSQDFSIPSIRCQGAFVISIVDEGNQIMNMKFYREDLLDVPVGKNVVMKIEGNFLDGRPFVSYATVNVISKQ